MARTLDQLFTSYTPDECKQRLLDRCTDKGLSTNDWYEGGVARTLIEIEAQENSDFSLSNVEIAKAAFFDSSPGGDWVTLDAKDWFSTPRLEATYYVHEIVCVNAGTSNITVVPGQLWAANAEGLRFVNINGGTLTVGGNSFYARFKAEYPGAAYSVEPTSILTPIPGLAFDGLNETVEYGRDAETDLALKARCYLKWSTLGTGMADDAYSYWAKSFADGMYCTKTKIVTSSNGSGTVTVYVGGPTGATGVVSSIQTLLRSKAGNAVTVNVVDVTTAYAAITAQVFNQYGWDPGGQVAAIQANLRAAILALEIGQTLYRAQIFDCFMSVPGVKNVILSLPAGDIVVGPYYLLTYQAPSLSWGVA